MKLKGLLLAASCAGIFGGYSAAAAQDVVFRRPIAASPTGAYAWSPSDYRPVDSAGNPLNEAALCGTYEVKRTAQCVRSTGGAVDSSFCSGLTQPALLATADFSGGCTYSWAAGGWTDPGASCTSSETQSRAVSCRVDQTGAISPDANCTGSKPAVSQSVADYSGCTYGWQASSWSDPGASCTASETQTRAVSCRRSDGTSVSSSNCSGTAPASTQTVADYSGCTYSWQAGSWSDPGASCTASETQTRPVSCLRSDGTNVSGSNCSGTAPASSQTVADYSGCTYSWETGAWNDPGASCSASETQTRSIICRRSNGDSVAGWRCPGAAPASSQTVSDYSGCSYGWQTSSWGSWSSTCTSSASRSRSVSCIRSDGTSVSGTNCTASKPATSETAAVYSGCSYSWATSSWVDPGASCTDAESQTRTVKCRRSDGTNVVWSNCSASSPPSSTRTVSDYSACSTQTSVSWGAWSSSCSSNGTETKTRTGTCMIGGSAVDDKFCETYGGKSLTQTSTIANSSSCTVTINDSYCTSLAKGQMASGPWWFINKPLSGAGGASDSTSEFKTYIDTVARSSVYDTVSWTWDATNRKCTTNKFANYSGPVSCEFKLDSNGKPYAGSAAGGRLAPYGGKYSGECLSL